MLNDTNLNTNYEKCSDETKAWWRPGFVVRGLQLQRQLVSAPARLQQLLLQGGHVQVQPWDDAPQLPCDQHAPVGLGHLQLQQPDVVLPPVQHRLTCTTTQVTVEK